MVIVSNPRETFLNKQRDWAKLSLDSKDPGHRTTGSAVMRAIERGQYGTNGMCGVFYAGGDREYTCGELCAACCICGCIGLLCLLYSDNKPKIPRMVGLSMESQEPIVFSWSSIPGNVALPSGCSERGQFVASVLNADVQGLINHERLRFIMQQANNDAGYVALQAKWASCMGNVVRFLS